MSAKRYPPENFIGRELSWLEFNQRVIDEAVTLANPVFERMKFLAIAGSNLDEFFMIRVASIWDQIDAGYTGTDAAGMSPQEQIAAITARVRVMMRTMYDVLRKQILPELAETGVRLIDKDHLTGVQAAYFDAYFEANIYPVLTPMAVDATRPFPLIYNRSLNLGLLLESEDDDAPTFATVQVPSGLDPLDSPALGGRYCLYPAGRSHHAGHSQALRGPAGAVLPPLPHHAQRRPFHRRGRRCGFAARNRKAAQTAPLGFRRAPGNRPPRRPALGEGAGRRAGIGSGATRIPSTGPSTSIFLPSRSIPCQGSRLASIRPTVPACWRWRMAKLCSIAFAIPT